MAQDVSQPAAVMVFSPDNQAYEAVDNQRYRGGKRFGSAKFYNTLFDEYNAAKVGAILVFPYDGNSQISNVNKVIHARGLERLKDYELTRLHVDPSTGGLYAKEDRPLKLKKLTDTPARLVYQNKAEAATELESESGE